MTVEPDKTREIMQDIAKDVHKHLPTGFGFMVLVFPFNTSDGRMNYVSNGQRKDCINAMKEFLIRQGEEEDWMKHLE